MLLLEIHIYLLVIIINEASDGTVIKPVVFVTFRETANISTKHVLSNINKALLFEILFNSFRCKAKLNIEHFRGHMWCSKLKICKFFSYQVPGVHSQYSLVFIIVSERSQ